MAFANENAYVELYREAFKCQVQDFMISFHKEQMTVEKVLEVTADLFENLINSFDDNCRLTARLVAKCALFTLIQ